MPCQIIAILILLIVVIATFVAVCASSGRHDAAAVVGAVGTVSLAMLLLFGVFLGFNIWFLVVIHQYLNFLKVRFLSFRVTKVFAMHF